ncbi:MAG TPA: DUF6206 family protein [Spirochaetota bacterium]|nr:DUF6206 family protein [Spirochaetota bacterium]
MKKTDAIFIGMLRDIDAAYRLKSKRIRYMRQAMVSRGALALADGFDAVWTKHGDGYRLKSGSLAPSTAELLTGVFGRHDEARAILGADRLVVSMDREGFRAFLARHIESEAARGNLYRAFYGHGRSIAQLASLQVPWLERYLPTAARADGIGAMNTIFSKRDIANLRVVIDQFDIILENLEEDVRLYRGFARDFRALYRERAGLRIMGYGEISTVMAVEKGNWLDANFELRPAGSARWIWKKMPPFPGAGAVKEYARVYREYRDILVNDIGIAVPAQVLSYFEEEDHVTVYAGQERVDTALIGNVLIKQYAPVEAETLLLLVMGELLKVYRFNAGGGRVSAGLDGQLSNWCLVPRAPGCVTPGDSLVYIDTSSPLFRVDGKEQLDTELFIKNAPSFLRFLIRMFFLKEVVDRYYDMRSVVVDLIANLHKEKRADLIDGLLGAANAFMKEKEMSDRAITRKEIDKYYSGDAFIWRFFQFSRRVDKFIIEKILRKKYHYRLPEKIER